MIVVDANVLFPYVFEMETSTEALRIRKVDPDWRFPRLWRQEFSSAVLKYVRARRCGFATGEKALSKALDLYIPHEVEVSDRFALQVANEMGLSAYDALYVALAEKLDVQLVSGDKALVRRCSGRAVLMEDFGR